MVSHNFWVLLLCLMASAVLARPRGQQKQDDHLRMPEAAKERTEWLDRGGRSFGKEKGSSEEDKTSRSDEERSRSDETSEEDRPLWDDEDSEENGYTTEASFVEETTIEAIAVPEILSAYKFLKGREFRGKGKAYGLNKDFKEDRSSEESSEENKSLSDENTSEVEFTSEAPLTKDYVTAVEFYVNARERRSLRGKGFPGKKIGLFKGKGLERHPGDRDASSEESSDKDKSHLDEEELTTESPVTVDQQIDESLYALERLQESRFVKGRGSHGKRQSLKLKKIKDESSTEDSSEERSRSDEDDSTTIAPVTIEITTEKPTGLEGIRERRALPGRGHPKKEKRLQGLLKKACLLKEDDETVFERNCPPSMECELGPVQVGENMNAYFCVKPYEKMKEGEKSEESDETSEEGDNSEESQESEGEIPEGEKPKEGEKPEEDEKPEDGLTTEGQTEGENPELEFTTVVAVFGQAE